MTAKQVAIEHAGCIVAAPRNGRIVGYHKSMNIVAIGVEGRATLDDNYFHVVTDATYGHDADPSMLVFERHVCDGVPSAASATAPFTVEAQAKYAGLTVEQLRNLRPRKDS